MSKLTNKDRSHGSSRGLECRRTTYAGRRDYEKTQKPIISNVKEAKRYGNADGWIMSLRGVNEPFLPSLKECLRHGSDQKTRSLSSFCLSCFPPSTIPFIRSNCLRSYECTELNKSRRRRNSNWLYYRRLERWWTVWLLFNRNIQCKYFTVQSIINVDDVVNVNNRIILNMWSKFKHFGYIESMELMKWFQCQKVEIII